MLLGVWKEKRLVSKQKQLSLLPLRDAMGGIPRGNPLCFKGAHQKVLTAIESLLTQPRSAIKFDPFSSNNDNDELMNNDGI